VAREGAALVKTCMVAGIAFEMWSSPRVVQVMER
jgi:hypothetical protein